MTRKQLHEALDRCSVRCTGRIVVDTEDASGRIWCSACMREPRRPKVGRTCGRRYPKVYNVGDAWATLVDDPVVGPQRLLRYKWRGNPAHVQVFDVMAGQIMPDGMTHAELIQCGRRAVVQQMLGQR